MALGADTDLAVSVMIICGFGFLAEEADAAEAPAVVLMRRAGAGGSGNSCSRHCETFLAMEVDEMILCAWVIGGGFAAAGGGGGGVFGNVGSGGAGGSGADRVSLSVIEGGGIVSLSSLGSFLFTRFVEQEQERGRS